MCFNVSVIGKSVRVYMRSVFVLLLELSTLLAHCTCVVDLQRLGLVLVLPNQVRWKACKLPSKLAMLNEIQIRQRAGLFQR